MKKFFTILLYIMIASFTSVKAQSTSFHITDIKGHTIPHKPSLQVRLNGTQEVVLIVPRNPSSIESYYYQCLESYFREIGAPLRVVRAHFKRHKTVVGGSLPTVWATLDEDVSDSWHSINTLIVLGNCVSSLGYYRGEVHTAQIDILDPINEFSWKITFDIPNKGEKFKKLLKQYISPLYSYSPQLSFQPTYKKSNWKESDYRQYFSTGNISPLEGEYQGDKYKLAVKHHDDGKTYLIYLNGAPNGKDWTEGDVKAILEPTATPTIYKAKWYDQFKDIWDYTIIFSEGLMTTYDEDKDKEIYLKMYPSATSVSEPLTQEWSGSGFALNNGCIATNYHVVENATSIKVLGVNGNFNVEYDATVIATDKYNDLAIVQITDNQFNGFGTVPYRVKTSLSEVGEDVFVLGYPLTATMGDEVKLTTGVISSKTGFQGDVALYQISAPIQPGNSGGPLFDNSGNLIGIVTAKHKGTENVSYAIKASYLHNLVESTSSSKLLPSNNTVSGMTLSNKVKSLKNFVFMIKCSGGQN